MQVLVAATKTGVEVLHTSEQFGTLELGKAAQIVAGDGNLLQDVRALRRTRFVVQEGRVVRLNDPSAR
jgi:imidazolonepropionase-like amidohydrolase